MTTVAPETETLTVTIELSAYGGIGSVAEMLPTSFILDYDYQSEFTYVGSSL